MSKQAKVGLAFLILIAAGFLWYRAGSEERALLSEQVASLRGVTYRVECDSCGHVFQFPADEYVRQAGDGGITCSGCGKRSARRSVAPSDGIEDSLAEVASITSIDEVRAQSEQVALEIRQLEEKLFSPDVSGNEEKEAELRRQLEPLQKRYQALGLRWDQLKGGG